MRRTRTIALIALSSCGGAEPDSGLDLWLRIPGAQLARDDMPAAAGGPDVTFVDLRTRTIVAGQAGTPVSGRVQAGAFSIHVGLTGDGGHWIVPVGLPDAAIPQDLDWQARMDFSRDLPPGAVMLRVVAVDGRQRAGAGVLAELEAVDGVPDGELVVSLQWDMQADVDLLVTDPDGVQVGPKNINSYEPPPPGQPPDPPDAWQQGGILDLDSNSGCIIDGIRRENAVWTQAPPVGRYVVHVAMTRPCGQTRASFRVTVRAADEVIARAEGVLYEIDARLPGGVRALEFELGP